MLVIISDLHLTDGTSGETINAGAFSIFRQRLADLAYDASWRSNDRYQPIERLDLLLLGDILDPIRSTKWLEPQNGVPVRPWSDPHSQPFTDKVRTVTRAILERNAESLGELRRMVNGEEPLTIPPTIKANTRPRIVSRNPRSTARQPVEVRLHYLVGNHDWFYNLPGPAHNDIRREIVEAMGLAHPPTEPFPHDPAESPAIQQLYAPYQLFARHGDIFDSFNYEGNRRASSLGDAIVVELLNRFPAAVEAAMGQELPEECLKNLREIDNVRPLLIVPLWLNSLLRRTVPDKRKRDRVKDIWDDLADQFLKLDFVRERDRFFDLLDDVDKLEWALKFSRGLSLEAISKLVTWVQLKLSGGEVTYHHHAFEEPAFLEKKARFIVHGHTHVRQVVPLDSAVVGGRRLDQMYLNAGTWRRIHELARYAPTEQEFMGYHEMTYFAFFKGDERKGRPFEAWTGNLGVA